MKELQIENGNYTRIVNKVIDELVKARLLGSEYAICLFIIRKTYGFNKVADEISLSQFEKYTNLSRPTIVKTLKHLQLLNILLLIKHGDSKKCSDKWKFNKYYKDWRCVKPMDNNNQLVKGNAPTGKVEGLQLVNSPLPTKDNTKGLEILRNKMRQLKKIK